jgi:Dolichyl-phosphate-mannose-protein mannosyltransferase
MYFPQAFPSPVLFLGILGVSLIIGTLTAKKILPGISAFGFIESPLKHSEKLLLTLIVLIALALRAYCIDFGLPYNFHPDEIAKVNVITNMHTKAVLDPNYFLHPSILLYSTYALTLILKILGLSDDFRISAFLAGRLVSLLAGTFSVYLVFAIARRCTGSTSALISAALLAVFPLHVTCSRYLKEDALLTFFILLSCVLALKAVQENKIRYIYLSALAAGFACSTKYSGMLACCFFLATPFFFATPWLSAEGLSSKGHSSKKILPNQYFLKHTVFALLLVPIGFLIGTPYSILNSGKFIKDFMYEKRHMQGGHTSAISAWSQYWMYYFSRCIIPGIGILTSICVCIAIGVTIVRKRLQELAILAALILFYTTAEYVSSKPAPQPERYILPCLPFIAIILGNFYSLLLTRVKNAAVFVFLIVLSIVEPFTRTIQLASELRPDTREIMKQYVEETLPQGSKILIDWREYSSPLDVSKYQIEYLFGTKILEKIQIRKLKESGYEYLILSSLFFDRFFTEPNVEAIRRSRIRDVFNNLELLHIVRSNYGTYGFHNPRIYLFKINK